MEYRTVSTKLPSNELTLFRVHCEKKGITPAKLLRELILREMEITVPNVVAGKNVIKYNKKQDSFSWSIILDTGRIVEIIENISPDFIESLNDNITISLEERNTFIQKKEKDSVSIPTSIARGKS